MVMITEMVKIICIDGGDIRFLSYLWTCLNPVSWTRVDTLVQRSAAGHGIPVPTLAVCFLWQLLLTRVPFLVPSLQTWLCFTGFRRHLSHGARYVPGLAGCRRRLSRGTLLVILLGGSSFANLAGSARGYPEMGNKSFLPYEGARGTRTPIPET